MLLELVDFKKIETFNIITLIRCQGGQRVCRYANAGALSVKQSSWYLKRFRYYQNRYLRLHLEHAAGIFRFKI
jgi:hypothetical protein